MEDLNHELLKAMYLQQRELTIMNHEKYSDSYVFAWISGVFPTQHVDDESYLDIYQSIFPVPKKFTDDVLSFIDDIWRAKENFTFAKLEDNFGGHHVNRMSLVFICRYAYMQDMFKQIFDGYDFWKIFLYNAPLEAQSIRNGFNIEDHFSKDE